MVKGEERVSGVGFLTIYIDGGDGVRSSDDIVLFENLFLHTGLPVSALTAAGCDQGVGSPFIEEFGIPDPCAAE
jgi:hypothetical protein